MSVPKSKRGIPKLQVITKSRLLASYSLRITQNEKSFPKRHRPFVRSEICQVAIDISAAVYSANSIYVTTPDDYTSRRALQQEALRLTYRLLNNIGIWHQIRHIDGNRLAYWAGLIMDVQSFIRSWRDSDAKRYKDMPEQEKIDAPAPLG